MIDIKSPSKVYTVILDEVNKLLVSFENQEKDEEIARVQEAALKKLNEFRREIQNSLLQLEKNSEWKVFIMAFYGETNAGKSTLIETLRILLSEPGKMKERQEFARLFEEYNQIQRSIEECQKSLSAIMDESKEEMYKIENELHSVSDQMKKNESELSAIKKDIDELTAASKSEKKSSVRNFFLYLFGRHPTQRKIMERSNELTVKQNDIVTITLMRDKLTQSKEKLINEIDEKTKELINKKEQLTNQAVYISEQITACADGRIIGDGRSDYTRTVTNYEFDINNQKFALLDLPGIEGNEKPVLDNINMAVQKAHVVFYVTGKPAPPQTGDEKVEGTLEKIKKHLGQQTEVYSIFNKRVKNPNSLKEKLIDENEAESLKDLDKTMRKHLGDQYKHCILLSAYPAFLSQANCWQNEYETKKEKFIEHFESPQLLLEKSKVQSFSSLLVNDIVINSKTKIKKSNFKKATGVLGQTREGLRQIQENFTAFHKKLIKTKTTTNAQLDEAIKNLENRFSVVTHREVENFKNKLRNKIYEDIDTDINNKEFKAVFENRTKDGIKKLQNTLTKNFIVEIDNFKDEVSNIVKKYQKYAEELLKVYNGINKFDRKFELNIDIKSGINWVGMLASVAGSIVGIILLISNPAGWVALALGIVGLIISVIKAFWGFLNHNYRKSQQRKSADENIEKMGTKIINEIKKNLAETKKPVRSGIEDIKNELTKTINRVKMINDILAKAEKRIVELAVAIKTEGEH